MHRFERFKQEGNSPSFSSSLLDEIYRSICESDTKHGDLKFYGDTMPKKQAKVASLKSSGVVEGGVRRARLIEEWIDQKVTTQSKRPNLCENNRKSLHHHNLDSDALFFSSTSSSSDSSSGGFSSSDTESFNGARSISSSFAPTRPKPVRTSITARSEKTETTLFREQRELHIFGGTEETPRIEESIIKSKSRALKIYNNLKKVKQPISPGGKLANFINSIFANGNSKKSKNSPFSSYPIGNGDEERKIKSAQATTCSSASSFSRSCLSKSSPSTREKFRSGDKRTVRFYPVSVIVDEDCRPCGHKSLYEEEQSSSLMSVSLPTAWKIGKSPSRKADEELKFQVMEKSRRVEEVARELLRDYHHNQKKKDDKIIKYKGRFEEDDVDDDDDAASYSSSDLFELDHLRMIGSDRYCQELPVYETTHVDTNRAIANGLIM